MFRRHKKDISAEDKVMTLIRQRKATFNDVFKVLHKDINCNRHRIHEAIREWY